VPAQVRSVLRRGGLVVITLLNVEECQEVYYTDGMPERVISVNAGLCKMPDSAHARIMLEL